MTATVGNVRNGDLPTLAGALRDNLSRSVDVVAPASKIRAHDGAIVVEGVEPIVGEPEIEGVDATRKVTDPNGIYRPTKVGDEGLSTKLSIPGQFLTRSRDVLWTPADAPGSSNPFAGGVRLWDHNVNAMLAEHARNGDPSFLLRMLTNRDGDPSATGHDGVMRAFLSPKYRAYDSFDVLLAALEGLTEAGAAEDVEIDGDITDRRTIVRVRSTQVAALAPKLLENYRSPFDGQNVGNGWTPERVANAARYENSNYAPGTEPIVFAGFVLSNSDVGCGALDFRPRLVVRVCKNGLTINAEAQRKVHLGGRLDDGGVQWSDATLAANLTLVKRQVADAVSTWMNPEFLTDQIDKIERAAGAEIGEPAKVIAAVSKSLGFTEARADSILNMFIRGGDMTAGGVMHAVTAAAQIVDDGDEALDMEMKALDAMALAASA